MLKQKYGRIVNMSPPISMEMLPGKVAYCISKFGMSLQSIGLGQELVGSGVTVNSLWPATLIESQATINFGMGSPEQWRKASILADATLEIIKSDENGKCLIDELFLRERGVTDFSKYSCVEGVDPPKMLLVENVEMGKAGDSSNKINFKSKL